MNFLVLAGVLLVIAAGVCCFLVALAAIDQRPQHVTIYVQTVNVVPAQSVGDQLEAEFQALDKR